MRDEKHACYYMQGVWVGGFWWLGPTLLLRLGYNQFERRKTHFGCRMAGGGGGWPGQLGGAAESTGGPTGAEQTAPGPTHACFGFERILTLAFAKGGPGSLKQPAPRKPHIKHPFLPFTHDWMDGACKLSKKNIRMHCVH